MCSLDNYIKKPVLKRGPELLLRDRVEEDMRLLTWYEKAVYLIDNDYEVYGSRQYPYALLQEGYHSIKMRISSSLGSTVKRMVSDREEQQRTYQYEDEMERKRLRTEQKEKDEWDRYLYLKAKFG